MEMEGSPEPETPHTADDLPRPDPAGPASAPGGEGGVGMSEPVAEGRGAEERCQVSIYLEVLAPANLPSGGTSAGGDTPGEMPTQISPVSETSELDTSADSGLTGDSEEAEEEEGEGDPCQTAPPEPVQPCQPSGSPDRAEDGTGVAARGSCHLQGVWHLSLDPLLTLTNHGHTATIVTPECMEREVLLDLVYKVQSRQFNDQRHSVRKEIRDRRGCHSLPTSPLEKMQYFFRSMSNLQAEEFFDLIARSQSRRLDDQRADFEESSAGDVDPKICEENMEYLDLVGTECAQVEGQQETTLFTSDRARSLKEEGMEPVEKETPAEQGEVPVESEQVPSEKEEIPVNQEMIPKEGEEPADDGNTPGEEEEPRAEDVEIPAGEVQTEKGEAPAEPAEGGEAPAELGAAPAAKQQNSAPRKWTGGGKDPDEELYNTILKHQSARARIEDQRSQPPDRSPREFFDLLQRLQERRMDEQRAALPPSLGPGAKRGLSPLPGDRRPSVFTPLLRGVSQKRANSS
ncbi:uncharacterized protein LOC132394539 [Hypanus sabinus]|uniref:uncharacterized protein LOC132394539 n=1 Tax=Hypanus sabinus TaxID=79690 RepID=UPI0028C48207|nr:uncharacterized protein LOC132394539 [Hypanus sabinus]XP_059826806.1 uncharacterized protein LOC132394539 [Hypanus sabinus]